MDTARGTTPIAGDQAIVFNAHLSGRRWFLTGLVAVLGLVTSVGLYWLQTTREQQLIAAQFTRDASQRADAVQRVMAARLTAVDALAAFFAGSDFVERHEFHTFSESLMSQHPGICALGWIGLVPADKRQVYEDRLKTVNADFQFFERTERGEKVAASKRNPYAPILYIEPEARNASQLGWELHSIEKCHAAMAEAAASNHQVAMVMPWPCEKKVSPCLCVFRQADNGVVPRASLSADKAGMDGFVVGIYKVEAMLDTALDFFGTVGIDVYLSPKAEDASNQTFVKRSSLHGEEQAITRLGDLPHLPPGALHQVTRFEIAGSAWTIECVPMPEYIQSRRTWGPLGVFGGGLLATGLLVSYLFVLTGRAERVGQLVAERTNALQRSEQRFRRLVDNASDGFYLTDIHGNIIDVSRQVCDILGYTREELLSMQVADIDIKFDPTFDPERHWKQCWEAYPLTFEGVHRRKDGSIFPVEIRLSPLESGGQRLLLALARDITDRKRAEQELQAEQRLLREMLDLQERDRRLVAYEIHDGLAQQLAGALYKFQAIDQFREHDPSEARATFDDAMRLLRDGMGEARRLISGLRPPVLDEAGIEAAVNYLIAEQQQHGGPAIEFICEKGLGRLAPPLEGAVFRIIQESLTNARRYSQSDKVRVTIRTAAQEVLIDVQDWGIGFDSAQVVEGHFGIKGIRERARLMGGSAVIETAPSEGTRIRVRLPLVRASESPTLDQQGEE